VGETENSRDGSANPGAWSPPVAFPVVGIGASAGGLAAFTDFFNGMPSDQNPGMAFVLVQHLAPDHTSILAELVRRTTRMPVCEATDGLRVRPNHVYTIPPDCDLVLGQGALHLLLPEAQRGLRLPIDRFFRTLARDQQGRAIGIILSGTGSDGAEGLRAIKAAGGLAMVQEPGTSQYDGMIRSALATGVVDLVVPPREMLSRLRVYAERTLTETDLPEPAQPAGSGDGLRRICDLLRAQLGHDFSHYKASTLLRRVERRMAVNELDTLDAFADLVQRDVGEARALFRDLLIGVTGFFRDAEAFAALEADAFAALEADAVPGFFAARATRTPNAPVRVWVTACATGEEAYSIAILLQEHLETLSRPARVQVFATDIDERAIDRAREGLFPASITEEVTPERLARFFLPEPDGRYRIRKAVREMLVFSVHDVIQDPPFSGIDLISCRNLFIYLTGELQKKLLSKFHFALVPGGVLFLGGAESVGECSYLFTKACRKHKLFRRVDGEGEVERTGFAPLARDWVQVRGRALPPDPGNARAGTGTLDDPPGAKGDCIRNLQEAMRTSDEELRSANEEMQSMNEELQSTNEELETSKEELQSINEELAIVNAELQAKVTGLARANNDMNNFLAGTGVATLFVDHHLRIVRFTPGATEMINLLAVDVGRPLAHIANNLVGYGRMLEDARDVLRDLIPRAAEVRTTGGAWFMMRLRPYRTLDNVIEGVAITFASITEQKEAERKWQESQEERDAILDRLGNPFLLLEAARKGDPPEDLRIHRINGALEARLGVRGEDLRGRRLREAWPLAPLPWLEACRRVLGGGAAEVVEDGGETVQVFRPGAGTARCCILFRRPRDGEPAPGPGASSWGGGGNGDGGQRVEGGPAGG